MRLLNPLFYLFDCIFKMEENASSPESKLSDDRIHKLGLLMHGLFDPDVFAEMRARTLPISGIGLGQTASYEVPRSLDATISAVLENYESSRDMCLAVHRVVTKYWGLWGEAELTRVNGMFHKSLWEARGSSTSNPVYDYIVREDDMETNDANLTAWVNNIRQRIDTVTRVLILSQWPNGRPVVPPPTDTLSATTIDVPRRVAEN